MYDSKVHGQLNARDIQRANESRLTLVDRAERSFLSAIESLTKLDLRDGAGTEVSNISGIPGAIVTSAVLSIITSVVWVGIISRRFKSSPIGSEWEGVGLGSKRDSSLRSRVEEQVGIICRILSLNETIKFPVLRSLLAEDGISESRRIRGEVWRGVLLGLTVLHSCSDHFGLSGVIELARSVYRTR